MKFKFLKSILVGMIISASSLANAGLIHTFEFDDLSAWNNVSNFIVGDSLTVTFDDNTDFNNVEWNDILSFQFNINAGSPGALHNADFNTNGNANDMFSFINNEVVLNFGVASVSGFADPVNGKGYTALFENNSIDISVEIGQTSTGSYVTAILEDTTSGSSYSIISTPIQVPAPASLAIFALGMLGLASRRFKNQS
jgi:hypothetical protein